MILIYSSMDLKFCKLMGDELIVFEFEVLYVLFFVELKFKVVEVSSI